MGADLFQAVVRFFFFFFLPKVHQLLTSLNFPKYRYYSGVVFDGYDDLACTWISLHHIDDKSVSGIQLHIHEFKYTESNNKSID